MLNESNAETNHIFKFSKNYRENSHLVYSFKDKNGRYKAII